MTYPLVSDHLLWCFSLDPSPHLIDLEHSRTQHTFGYPPSSIHNPSLSPSRRGQAAGQPSIRDYTGTQQLADKIRAYHPPTGSNQARPEGLKAPSVRMSKKNNSRPFHLALSVMPPGIHVPYSSRATLVNQWQLSLEFEQPRPRQPVTASTVEIGWTSPRFQLGPVGHPSVPAYICRPRATQFAVAPQWHLLDIRYA